MNVIITEVIIRGEFQDFKPLHSKTCKCKQCKAQRKRNNEVRRKRRKNRDKPRITVDEREDQSVEVEVEPEPDGYGDTVRSLPRYRISMGTREDDADDNESEDAD